MATGEHHVRQYLLWRKDMSDPAFNYGYSLFQSGKFRRAIEAFQQAIHNNTNNADAFNHLALCYDALAKHDIAVPNYKKAVEICERFGDEDNAAAMKVHLADSLISAKLYKEGEGVLQEVLGAKVEEEVKAQAISIFATSLIQNDKFDDALHKLKEGQIYLVESQYTDQQFGSGIFAMIRARIYTYKCDFQKALMNFDIARNILQDNHSAAAELSNYFGEFLLFTKEYNKALKHFKRSWKYFRDHKPSYAIYVAGNIADSYDKMGRKVKAESWRKKAREIISDP